MISHMMAVPRLLFHSYLVENDLAAPTTLLRREQPGRHTRGEMNRPVTLAGFLLIEFHCQPASRRETCDARHSDCGLDFISILHPVAMEPPTTERKQEMTMNRNGIDIRELTGELDCEELDLVSGGSGTAALGTALGDAAFAFLVAAKTVTRVAETVTGHPR
jgi:hypothetical protein